uniref:Dynamin-type G domain-containing protein n=1 Tax=Pinguiococcus pyrenoidosus TaxID=172671 RepID=A0A7R9YDP6_9STRA|mmetsp:Transcript_5048/g.20171  ORF Transcript_5048/g.20171 Transcript_5048/m.20171 type:complete len:494 (+) Transcript_5048:138-1619(+)
MASPKKNGSPTEQTAHVVANLKAINREYLREIEQQYCFDQFHHDAITDAELDAKPIILVVGQYSTGKTTFINQIIGQDYVGCHVGPEPTTDRFIACCYGKEKEVIQGNAISVDRDLPYNGLTRFGQGFLNKFSASFTPSEVLKEVNIIDTPGILSGEKQRLNRNYDFASVCRWFAERADMVLLLFDAHKLDISDEFKEIITSLRGLDNKVRCVLNKADQIDSERLVRVYGALLFNIGKILQTPEVVRVFIGSFWDQPLQHEDHKVIFEKDQRHLMEEIKLLPHDAASRKVDEMVKRVRLVKVQACILGHMRGKMPYLWGAESRKQWMIEHLQEIFDEVAKKYGLSKGDFPKVEEFAACLKVFDFRRLPPLQYEALETLQKLLDQKIPAALKPETKVADAPEQQKESPPKPVVQEQSMINIVGGAVLAVALICVFVLGVLLYLEHPLVEDLSAMLGDLAQKVQAAAPSKGAKADGPSSTVETPDESQEWTREVI